MRIVKNSDKIDFDIYVNGMSTKIMSNTHQAFSFSSYEKLLEDIKSNPKSKSAKALSKLTGEGGQFENMENVGFMRDAFGMDDDFIDRATGQLANMGNMPVMQGRKELYLNELDLLEGTRNKHSKPKKGEWWQFRK